MENEVHGFAVAVEMPPEMVFPLHHSAHCLCKLKTLCLRLFFALPVLNTLRLL